MVFSVAVSITVRRLSSRLDSHTASPRAVNSMCRMARPPHWPYTLFAMVHGKSRAEVDAAIDRLIAQHALAAWPHARLYTLHRYAQRGPHYA